MRTIVDIAEFIVEPIRSRIRASEQFRRRTYLFVRRRQLTHFDDSSSQPRAIGNRVIERCEIRAALHSFSLIPLNGELHVNTLEQSLAQFAYALTRCPAGAIVALVKIRSASSRTTAGSRPFGGFELGWFPMPNGSAVQPISLSEPNKSSARRTRAVSSSRRLRR